MADLIHFFYKMYFLYASRSRKKILADFLGVLPPKKGPKFQAPSPMMSFPEIEWGPLNFWKLL